MVHAVSCEHSSLHADRASLQLPCNEEMAKLQTSLSHALSSVHYTDRERAIDERKADRKGSVQKRTKLLAELFSNLSSKKQAVFESKQELSFTIRCAGFQDAA